MTQEEILTILSKKENNISQSEVWAEFQSDFGREVQQIRDNNFSALLVEVSLLKGKFCLFCSKGPVLQNKKTKETLDNFVEELKKDIASHIVFIRIDPILAKDNEKNILKSGFLKVSNSSLLSRQVSPKKTLVLDISKSEEEILVQMKQKTRYNIRLSSKKEVKVRKSIGLADIDIFYDLLREVSNRDSSFSAHPKEYYKKMVEVLGKEGKVELFIAEYKKEPLAAILVSFFGETAVYLHGASSSSKRELMAPYLLQWEAIKEAKKRGCFIYDFWGIAENDDPSHSWAGVTRFKKGFGGCEVEFAGSFDYLIQPFWYKGLSFINRIRKKIKRK